MTQTERAVRTGVVTAGVGSLMLWLASIAWAQKADQRQVDGILNREEMRALRDSAWKAETHAMLLELYCEKAPAAKRCAVP